MPTAKEMFYISNGVELPARKPKPPNVKQFFILPKSIKGKGKKGYKKGLIPMSS